MNSIDYKIKIFCVDKPIDLDNNLNILNNKIKTEKNKYKLKLLEEDYDFISSLNNKKSVVNREFYLILEETAENENLLNQKINDLIQEFSSIGLKAEKIASEEWRELLFVLLNPVSSLDLFKKDATTINRSFKERISPTGLKIGEKEVILGDAHISVVTLISYPSMVNVGWLGAVANIHHTRMTMTISPMDTQEISNTLKKVFQKQSPK